MNQEKTLNFKYMGIQFFYFAAICVLMSYGTVYLKEVGLTASIIGVVLSVANLISTFLQPALASYVEKKGLPVVGVLTVIGLVMAGLTVGLLVLTGVPMAVGVLFALLMAITTTMIPFINSLTFAFEKQGIEINYGLARGIGSASYAIVSLVLGYVTKIMSPKLLPFVTLAAIIGLLPLIRGFKTDDTEVEEKEEVVEEDDRTVIDFVKKYTLFFLFLLGYILIYIDHTVINTYMIYIVENIGGTTAQMGTATFIAAILELPAMAIFDKYKHKVNIPHILILSGIIYSIKHVLTVFAPNMIVFYIAQMLQMFAYGLFLPASVYYVNGIFSKKDAIKGQAFVTMSSTAAGIMANLLGGVMFDLTGVNTTLLVFAVLSVVGSIMLVFTTQPMRKDDE